ncbi:MAG TPA: hypothetical protein PLR20_03530 [Syntrophales bacterium]|jgi:hypothetical protein|nr:hypothetical protein [Syntrophales bacterium]HOX94233.1 hypothetical protein [Syntrophales bacterium]HPI55981.1 hypothetical protein [Syntrophales bacterium]HPN24129.1 hypothetical protein [Syntrophales bacterium]HQM28408.1 hypothetical protein [Syntrophales bacterium]
MAEIKSTLDIIMEKTKGLSLSAEEKETLRREEEAKKIRLWVGRFLDDKATLEDIGRELKEPLKDKTARDFLRSELIAHLHPEGDNGKVLRMMKELLHLRTEPLEKSMDVFLKDLIALRVARLKGLGEKLARSGVSGSAVLPNVAGDPEWASSYKAALEKFREQALNLTGS